MPLKRVIMSLLTAVLIMTATVSCGSSKSQDKSTANSSSTSMGRYVAYEMDYPENMDDSSQILDVQINPEGNLELYVNKSTGGLVEYVQKDGVWTERNMNELSSLEIGGWPEAIFYGEDKKQYVQLMMSTDVSPSRILYRRSENGTYEKVLEIKMEDANVIGNDLKKIEVLKNGMIAVLYYNRHVKLYSSDGLTEINDLEISNNFQLAVEEYRLYYTDPDGKSLLCYNAETNQEEAQRSIEKTLSFASLLDIENETVYLYDMDGFHINQQGSSLWVTIIDEKQKDNLYKNFIYAGDGDYYVHILDMKKDKN